MIGMQVSLVLLVIDGLYFEPFRLTLTRQHVSAPQFISGRDLRILQISDLHVERITQREQAVLEMARSLQPDLIVLTGDYVNLDYVDDETALAEARKVISQLEAPYGVYAIIGSVPVDTSRVMATVFGGLKNVHVLRNEIQTIDFPGGRLSLLGITLNRNVERQVLEDLVGQIPADAYSLLLYHTPDLIETASVARIDLYWPVIHMADRCVCLSMVPYILHHAMVSSMKWGLIRSMEPHFMSVVAWGWKVLECPVCGFCARRNWCFLGWESHKC